jgi:hypothetical protein
MFSNNNNIFSNAAATGNIRMAGVFRHHQQYRYVRNHAGEQDEKGFVNLPQGTTTNFDNGFLVGEIIRKLTTDAGRKVPTALATVKADPSKNAKLTNWNFIWYV